MSFWKADRTVADLSQRWAKPPSAFVALDGMNVHVRDEGPRDAGHTIVLVHGTGNSLHTWDAWAQRLENAYRVIRFDRPGFGLTGPNPTGDYTMAYYAGFVERLLDVMHVDRCIIAGNSAGGGVAWRTALEIPHRIEGLVLLASSGYPRTTPRSTGFRIAMSPFGPFILHVVSRKAIDASVRATYGDPSKVTQELLDRSYEMTLGPGVRDALGATLRQTMAVDPASIARIAVPTLIVWGDRDGVVPVTDAALFARDVRGSEVVVLPGVGHLPQEEAPDESIAALEDFVRRLGERA